MPLGTASVAALARLPKLGSAPASVAKPAARAFAVPGRRISCSPEPCGTGAGASMPAVLTRACIVAFTALDKRGVSRGRASSSWLRACIAVVTVLQLPPVPGAPMRRL